jgi:hypothetical protein
MVPTPMFMSFKHEKVARNLRKRFGLHTNKQTSTQGEGQAITGGAEMR